MTDPRDHVADAFTVEAGEEHLQVLIAEAGEEARRRRREAMERHQAAIRSAIAEAADQAQPTRS
jgi:vacuolar-type H+-ATPase subunit E/Vma4